MARLHYSQVFFTLPEHHQVLHHLLAQVVVNAIDLVLFKQCRHVIGQIIGAIQVLAKGLLHNQPIPAT